jgi:hypothetical protein
LDPCHYVSTPSFGWDAMLLKTKVNLDLIADCDMNQFLERGIRGGQSVIFKKYAKANNKYLSNYNPSEPSTYISYLDANNLHGIAVTCKLPKGEFQWGNGDDISIDDIMNYNEDNDHFEKDYFELMNRAVSEKTMDNIRDRKEIKKTFDETYYRKYVSKPNFHSSKILVDDKMMLMKLTKTTVRLNKPIYA